MTKTAFQQEREASSGKRMLAQPELDAAVDLFRGRVGARCAAGGCAVKQPGFALKAYHDKVLSYGSPPARYVRALMFDLPIT